MSPAPRHIVFVLSGLTAGGAEKTINLIARHRLEAGDRISVLAFTGHPNDSFFPYPEAIAVRTRQAEKGTTGVFARLVWLRRTLADLRPDLVISFLTKINVLSLLASVGKPWPVVISERNNPVAQPAHPLWAWLTRLTTPRAQAIVMQTDAAKACLPRSVLRHAHVIGNPCTLSQQRTPSPTSADRFVAVGRLTDQKGFQTLIDAFAIVHHRHPRARLTIYGEGPDRAALQARIAHLELDSVVHLPGVSATPGGWIDEADTFVLSSRYEGFPNVLAEAMAAGLAVISTDCDWGPSELVTHGATGLLVAPDDAAELGAAMIRMLDDPALRNRLASAAKASAQSRFTLARVLAQWDRVIDQTMEAAHG